MDANTMHATILRAIALTKTITALLDQVRRFADTNTYGIEYQDPAILMEDKRAVDILGTKTKKFDVGYQAPVLWKDDTPSVLPDIRIVADNCLRRLLKKFDKCGADYEKQFRSSMKKSLQNRAKTHRVGLKGHV